MAPDESYFDTKRRLMDEYPPTSGDNLLGMVVDVDYCLEESPLFSDFDVSTERDSDSIVSAICKVTYPGSDYVSDQAIIDELEQLWTGFVAYGHFEAHTIQVTGRDIVLDGITLPTKRSYYATVRFVVSRTGNAQAAIGDGRDRDS